LNSHSLLSYPWRREEEEEEEEDAGRGTRDEGREQIIFDVDLLFQMCVCRPNLRWAREKI